MVTVKKEDFINASKKMDEAANRIDVSLSHIDSIMNDLNSVWEDSNSKRYLNQYHELQKYFPEFKASIHRYSTFLNSLLEIYQKEFSDSNE